MDAQHYSQKHVKVMFRKKKRESKRAFCMDESFDKLHTVKPREGSRSKFLHSTVRNRSSFYRVVA